MRVGSLFAGIGGLELGLEWAGVGRAVWQVERDPFCRQVLAKHWPDAERFDDVRTVGAANLPRVDVICGGFPCQDISYAGKGAGLAGERSGLWYEFARIVRELRPRFVVVENVSALLSRGLDSVLGTLASLGYDAEWSSLRASDVGAAHRRDRVFIIAWRAEANGGLMGDAVRERRPSRDAFPWNGSSRARASKLDGVRGQDHVAELAHGAGARWHGNAGCGHSSARGPSVRSECGGGELAYPRRDGIERRRGSGFVARASRSCASDGDQRQRDGDSAGDCGETLAHDDSGRWDGVAVADGEHEPEKHESSDGIDGEWSPLGGRELVSNGARAVRRGCGGDDGRRERVGLGGLLDGERTERGHDADRRGGTRHLGGRDDREQIHQGGGQTQPGVGRATHGLSARLDVARPGEAQAEWEAPRVVVGKVAYRADRLKALGNAVVPQVAEVVGRRLIEIAVSITNGHHQTSDTP